MYNIAVVGCGVIGLTTAIQLQKDLENVNVTIFTEKLSPNTTGDVSAGLWTPYLLGGTPAEKVLKWSQITHDYFFKLWKDGFAQKAGICLQPILKFYINSENNKYSDWIKIPYGATPLTRKQLEIYNRNKKNKYSGGVHFVSFTCEPTKLLPFLMKKFTQTGGNIVMKKINSLEQLSNYDVVVNCTGLESRRLAQDKEVHPIRGQIIRVKAPWQFEVLSDEDDTEFYIIPNSSYVILGGTHQYNDENLSVSQEDKENILRNCSELVPGLQVCDEHIDSVGLRPGRSQVRIEAEQMKSANKTFDIVHNYGHGGSGVTLCVGCAVEASEIVKKVLSSKKLRSSL